jgi:hypothetical protein
MATMVSQFTPADRRELLPWLVASLGAADRRTYLGMVENTMPPEQFVGVLDLIREGVAPGVWESLER